MQNLKFIAQKALVLILLFGYTIHLPAQQKSEFFQINGSIKDLERKEGIESVSVMLLNETGKIISGTITNAQGEYSLSRIPKGRYTMVASIISYEKRSESIEVDKNRQIDILLKNQAFALGDVVVTARESRHLRTISSINKEALNLLQPSSITDVLELLPGGKAADPVMNKANIIHLRENNTPSEKYGTGALGTTFIIDGSPISTNSDLQGMRASGETFVGNKSTIGMGLDMRTLAADDIENIQIERGIPSVEYGDLTDGLVKITRKKGANPWEARFKSDLTSKLYYIGKGWGGKKSSLNIGISFIHSNKDPRDPLEEFKRLSFSVRNRHNTSLGKHRLIWSSNLDFNGSFDNYKKDNEQIIFQNDFFKNSRQRYSWSNNLDLYFKELDWISRWNNLISISLGNDRMKRRQTIFLTRPSAVPNEEGEGEFIGTYIAPEYVSEWAVKGIPLTVHAKSMIAGQKRFGRVLSQYKTGVEWQLDKNSGDGLVFDRFKPPYLSNMRSRNRKFSEIPAFHQLSAFAEITTKIPVGEHRINSSLGIRATGTPGLSSAYRLSKIMALDPRMNIQWLFPEIEIRKNPLQLSLQAGYGRLSKFPTIGYLYPEHYYDDLVELNYHHQKPELRRIVFRSYETNPTNYELSYAQNHKWEVRFDASYKRHNLSITVYRENLRNGFRPQTQFRALTYKKYDYSGIDHDHITAPPDHTQLPFARDTLLRASTRIGNGSHTEKQGVEFQYNSPRIPVILTRITFNGAYFHNNYSNSQAVYKHPSVILNNKEYPFVGKYRFDDGYTSDYMATNLMFDTYAPRLGMNFMFSIQGVWKNTFTSKRIAELPITYIDKQEQEHVYTPEMANDPLLRWLSDISANNEKFVRKEPISVFLNFKGTKTFGKHFTLALFVNRLLDIQEKIVINGYQSRRQTDPYFGMELNVKI